MKSVENSLVVFVCTGNICRSPMAEYILRKQLPGGSGWTVASAGTAASEGFSASASAVAVLAQMGINAEGHSSQPMTNDLADRADVIVAMTVAHREILLKQFPQTAGKVYLLKSFDLTAGGWDIDDPIGLSIDVYRGICREIESAMPGLISFLVRQDVPGARQDGGWATRNYSDGRNKK